MLGTKHFGYFPFESRMSAAFREFAMHNEVTVAAWLRRTTAKMRRKGVTSSVRLPTQRRRPHSLACGINYALKLLLACRTGERLSLVFESVIRGRSAPR